MDRPQQPRGRKCWGTGLLAGLLLAVLPMLGYGLEGPEPPAGEARPVPRLHLSVRQGRLSVDLREAEVGEVLARIGHEAGVVILGNPTSRVRVSAQFTDTELEDGLRRLLRLASLSYAIRYAQGPAGMAAMHEVRVFTSTKEEPSPPPDLRARDAEGHAAEGRLPETHASGQVQSGPPDSQRRKAGEVWRQVHDRARR